MLRTLGCRTVFLKLQGKVAARRRSLGRLRASHDLVSCASIWAELVRADAQIGGRRQTFGYSDIYIYIYMKYIYIYGGPSVDRRSPAGRDLPKLCKEQAAQSDLQEEPFSPAKLQ